MDDLRTAASQLAARARQPLPFEPVYHPLPAAEPDEATRPVIAVDGSSAVLVDNGSTWVVAVRAEALAWPGPRPPEPQPRILAASPAEAADQVQQAYADAGFEAGPVRTAAAWAAAWQALSEWSAAKHAMAKRPTLLLIDGALRGLPQPAQDMADALWLAADDADVRLVGVAKRSGVEDGFPLRLMDGGPAGAWRVDVPGQAGVHVAKLHTRSQHAFRVDAARADTVAALQPLCRDAAYVGYPYPLALVHNRVAFTAGRTAELKAALDRELRRQGRAASLWAADFHDVLDRNVTG